MARAAVESDVGTMVATPHLRTDFPDVHVEEIGRRCQEIQAVLEREQIPLRVVSGAEVSLVWALEASDEQLKLASFGQRGTDLLIETPFDVSMIEQLLFAITSKGFRVTLAHPERSYEFQSVPGRLERLSRQGVLLQINGGALMSRRGRPGRLAEQLCRDGLAHVIASDGHRSSRWRPVTDLPQGFNALRDLVGAERAQWMASHAPAAIVAGAELPPAPSAQPARGPGRLFRR